MKGGNGVRYALASAFFLGLAPIFGKQAINATMPPLGLVALRTLGASLLLFLTIALFRRNLLYIYPLGLIGCLLAGGINGMGSLFYYLGLARLDAGVAQLLYSFYPLFVALVLRLDGQRLRPLTLLRLTLGLAGVFLLTRAPSGSVDLVGVLLMLTAAFLYGLHIPINQRVLFEAPAPTVTLYTLFAMTGVVVPAYLLFGGQAPLLPQGALFPLLGLTLVTFLSRLTLFFGVKRIGGMQTALLGLGELVVALALAHLWLGESLTATQWIGALMLTAVLLLVAWDQPAPTPQRGVGWLHWLLPPATSPVDLSLAKADTWPTRRSAMFRHTEATRPSSSTQGD